MVEYATFTSAAYYECLYLGDLSGNIYIGYMRYYVSTGISYLTYYGDTNLKTCHHMIASSELAYLLVSSVISLETYLYFIKINGN